MNLYTHFRLNFKNGTLQLEHLGTKVCNSVFGCNFTADTGGSNEWLFLADLPDTHLTGNKAVVKVWCVPVDKVRYAVIQLHLEDSYDAITGHITTETTCTVNCCMMRTRMTDQWMCVSLLDLQVTKQLDKSLCVGQRHAQRVASYLTALDKLTADCGLHDVAVRVS